MYKITYTTRAAKTLLKMPRDIARLIREKMGQVAVDPFVLISNAKKIQGRSGYRLRVGDWRVIYEINKDQVLVVVMKIAPRGEVYK